MSILSDHHLRAEFVYSRWNPSLRGIDECFLELSKQAEDYIPAETEAVEHMARCTAQYGRAASMLVPSVLRVRNLYRVQNNLFFDSELETLIENRLISELGTCEQIWKYVDQLSDLIEPFYADEFDSDEMYELRKVAYTIEQNVAQAADLLEKEPDKPEYFLF